MLQDLDREVNTEEELTGEPTAWRHVYMSPMKTCLAEQIYRVERRLLEGAKSRSRLPSESAYPPITITNVLPAQATQPGMSSSPPTPEDASICSTKASRLKIAGFRDANVQAYCDCCQSQVANELWKDEFHKACDVALGDGLDLDQIDELSDPEYFKNRGVRWGIPRRFVRDIRDWVDRLYCYVNGGESD
ncbi:hypothetical protein AtubIFM56815_004010 [Aspergillus tubingensis]|uniref:Uncharacterized protein n=1 Tax=Aspergillus tubingensis TaxID=5068 RepID=A0A9W6AWA6_ASPTU|nr:hypothetical protein AtubIFM56815_004010 [Aspergillus tubingensis]